MDNSSYLEGVYALREQTAFPKADFALEYDGEQYAYRHETQPSGLDKQKNDNLSKYSPVRPGVDPHQPGNTGGGSSSKQGVAKVRHFSASGGEGHHQQERSKEYQA